METIDTTDVWALFLEEIESMLKKKLWKNSPEYQEQQLLVRKLSTEIESRFTEFDPQLWELVQAYLLEEDSCYDIEVKSAYLQGGADFMKILALANRKL